MGRAHMSVTNRRTLRPTVDVARHKTGSHSCGRAKRRPSPSSSSIWSEARHEACREESASSKDAEESPALLNVLSEEICQSNVEEVSSTTVATITEVRLRPVNRTLETRHPGESVFRKYQRDVTELYRFVPSSGPASAISGGTILCVIAGLRTHPQGATPRKQSDPGGGP